MQQLRFLPGPLQLRICRPVLCLSQCVLHCWLPAFDRQVPTIMSMAVEPVKAL